MLNKNSIIENDKPFKQSTQKGFTLIEVMIVVAIISILVAVALPTYKSSITRSKRADATSLLTSIANQQVQYFIDNRSYGTVSDLGLATTNTNNGSGTNDCSANAISPDGYYCVAITGTPSSYLLTATPQGSQATDNDCATITYDISDTKSSTGGGTSCWGE